jgi:hypothetical protein
MNGDSLLDEWKPAPRRIGEPPVRYGAARQTRIRCSDSGPNAVRS